METNGISAGLRARIALEKYGFKTAHSLGQNFILDEGFLNHLLNLADIKESDNVLEIGPGPGLMTSLLAQRGNKILALELDERLKPVLSEVLSGYENAELIFTDAMKADLGALAQEKLGGKYRVVANLPYYITADLIQKMILSDPLPESICVMVQKEAAERLMSRVGMKNWCALSATVQYFGECEVLDEVPPELFNPPPHVDSCFIRISMREKRMLPAEFEADMLRLIRCCFAMRRKTLANNMKSFYGMKQEEVVSLIEAAGLKPQVRGEALSLEEIAALSKLIHQRQ